MRYLLKYTRRSFGKQIIGGDKIWQDHRDNMVVIISHPNGYGVQEHDLLRSAAVAAGFTAPTKSVSHTYFVTQAEASVHSCLHYADPNTPFRVS